MTVLVLDHPEMLAKAALLSAGTCGQLPEGVRRPHPTRFHYSFNKHILTDTDIEMLRRHARYLNSQPGLKLRLHGHTDNFGTDAYNRFLARRRINEVVRLLASEGVPEAAVEVCNWGSNRPLARPEDHAANRRIELEYFSQDLAKAL